jgi:sugar lactone lactonase YvrE
VSTIIPLSAGLDFPQGVAVDGVGNLFITDTGNHAVKKWTAANGVLSTLLGSGVANPWSVSVDGSGNAFFVDDFQPPVFEWVAASNSVVTVISSAASGPEGVTVDAAHNLYIADTGHNLIKEWIAANSTLVTLSSASAGLSVPTGLAVDGSDNLYIPNYSANSIIKWSAATGNQTTLTTSSSVNHPFGVAVDVAGNLYIADTSASVVRELPFAFVDPGAKSEPVTAGSDSLPAVQPASINLSPPFAPTSDQPWLTITGTANGVVSYSFTANSGAPRTAHIGLLGQSITVSQGGGSYTLGTTNLLVGPLAGTNSDILQVSGASTWTVSANVSWLHAQAGYANGAGSTNLLFTSDANPGITRTGILTVANQTLTVTQAGSNYVGVAGGTPAILTTNELVGPWDTALDASGNVYIADYNGNAVREWVKTNNAVITLVSGLSSPQGIAVDSLGNVYISDSYANSILEWTAANSNVTTLVSSGLNSPYGIAVDGSGNVYIADSNDNAIKEWIATNGMLTTLVSAGVTNPTGVAVDLLGNVYFSELDGSTLKKWSPVTGTTKILATHTDGLIYPFNLAVDGSGNVYIGDPNDGTIQEWSAAYGTISVAASGFESWGAGVDASGNIFVADSTGALSELQRAFVNPSARAEPVGAGTDVLPVVVPANAFQMPQFFPTSDQPWVTITGVTNGVTSFSFTANTTAAPRSANINLLGLDIPVNQGYVLLGATNLLEGPGTGADSVILATSPQYLPWTAAANTGWLHLAPAYQSGTASTNVVFTFDANPGAIRTGTLILGNQTLAITQAGSTYVPAPASMTALVPYGLVAPANSAVDGAGNLYIAAAGNPAISEWTPSNNSITTLASAGLDHPTGIVLDGQGYGYVFIADLLSNAVYAVIPPSTNLYPLVTTGLSFPFSLAVDSSVNIYIADSGNNAIKKFSLGDGTVTPVVMTGLSFPEGVAVDLAGNVYIADTGNNAVKEWIAASSNVVTLVSTGLNGPSGVAVDGSGNVYIADSGNNAFKKWTAATRNVTTVLSSGLIGPTGVAVDNADNVYIADYGNNAVEELPRAFVDPTARAEGFAAGSDVLPVVLPASINLLPPFAPTSDQPWLTMDGANSGVVGFSFTNNPGVARSANINLLGQLISVTQSNLFVTSPLLTSPKILTNGAFQFNFTNTPGAPFTVLSTTNLTLPLSNWTTVGAPSNLAPGLFQFTTQPLTNDLQRFYRVSSP